MNIQPQQQISDDQELAKVLAGITAGADGTAPTNLADDLAKEAEAPADDEISIPVPPPPADPVPDIPAPTPVAVSTPAPVPSSGLESIKNDALNELRPLVDKLNVSAEEKFDTYLLLLRSTDDTTLVAPAFASARAIVDESQKAQALLDIVKEIDYLSNAQKQTT